LRSGLKRTDEITGSETPVPPGPPAHPNPEPDGDLFPYFREAAIRIGGNVVQLEGWKKIPLHVAGILREKCEPMKVALGADETIRSLPWKEAGIEVCDDLEIESGQAGVSRGICAVAETGSVVFFSGIENPTRITFLVKYHFVVLSPDEIVPYLEDVWSILRRRFGNGRWPRAVNFVNGPSATADVEAILTVGAHGPCYFEVLFADRAN